MSQLLTIASLVSIAMMFFAIASAIENVRLARAMKRSIEAQDLQRKEQDEERARKEQVAKAIAMRMEARHKAKRFQLDIDQFPGVGVSFLGQPFNGWENALQSLMDRGLLLDGPSEEFKRLKRTVQDGIAFNQQRVADASNSQLDTNTRASLSLSAVHVAEGKKCLDHLEAIEAGWRFDETDLATAPAVGADRKQGRL